MLQDICAIWCIFTSFH